MIPLPQLGVEFVLGLGAALLGANLWVLLRPRVQRARGQAPVPRPPSIRRVGVSIAIGAVVTIWALATLLAR